MGTKMKLSDGEKKDIVATVICIATETLFKNHLYSFGGKMYRQVKGGPIGLRGTCAIARLVMQMWDSMWMERLSMLKVVTMLAMRYMDDGRTFLHPFKAGWRWHNGELKFCKKWAIEDVNVSGTERTKRVIQGQLRAC